MTCKPGTPRSAIGFLVAALARQRIAGAVPFTVLSCDNLSANGHTVGTDRDAVRRLAIAQSRQMDEAEVAFPFDHGGLIVPETTDLTDQRFRRRSA